MVNSLFRHTKMVLDRYFDRAWIIFCSSLVMFSHVNKVRIGSEYGGWTICPSRIGFDSIVFSAGIGEDITFDTELIKQYCCSIRAFDPTPRVLAWLKEQDLPEKFIYLGVGIANFDGEANFFPPENPNFVSHSILKRSQTEDGAIIVKVKKLATLMRESGLEHIDILKMDIEGAEYNVISDILSDGILPGQILVEFHHFQPNIGRSKTIKATMQLLLHGYRIFNVSSSGHEYSFIRKGVRH